jgi:hypothetical protein
MELNVFRDYPGGGVNAKASRRKGQRVGCAGGHAAPRVKHRGLGDPSFDITIIHAVADMELRHSRM